MNVLDQKTKDFILKHLNQDVNDLSLKSSYFKGLDKDLIIRQINGKQKVRNKIPVIYENEDILYPEKLSIEQSSSQKTASYKSQLFGGERIIDLTGGFGIDMFFLSSRFQEKIFIERNLDLCAIAKHNFEILKINDVTIIQGDCIEKIEDLPDAHLIYLDPHRRNDAGEKTVLISDCEPDILPVLDILIQKADNLMIKLSPMLDISQAVRDLKYVSEIHILSVNNDCKEVLYLLKKQISGNLKVVTINFEKTYQQTYHFFMNEEVSSIPEYTSELNQYIYEPNVSILKSGAFKLISNTFNVKKLHPNTHLYTSDNLVNNFPGRIFRVIQIFENKMIKEIAKIYPKANISFRNYPISVSEFRKNSRIKDGGDTYILGCKTFSEKCLLIACNRVSN